MKQFILKTIDKLISRSVIMLESRMSQNIRQELSLRALKTTVDYVENRLRDINSVDNKWKVHDVALNSVSVDGLFLEYGVFKAETINYIAKKTSRKVYGFDSFEGLPEFWRDGFPKGEFAVENLPQVESNVVLVKGWFDKTLPDFIRNKKEKIAYLHIDCDLYSSTKTIFDELKGKIVSGTVIVFDEYFNFPGWEKDEFKAFAEFIKQTDLRYEYLTYNHLHEQVAVKII